MTGGKRHLQNCKSAPFTCNLFASMPEVASTTVGDVKFSLMQPGTIVRPHTGPTNKRVRLHLGLNVPAGCCEITVGQEAREWADGELLIFDDSFEHSVAHTGESERLILIADVLHPQLEGTSGSHYAKPAE
jgi:aspartate beta-hydroxylase